MESVDHAVEQSMSIFCFVEYLLSFPTFVENLFDMTTEPLQTAIPDNVMQIIDGLVEDYVRVSPQQLDFAGDDSKVQFLPIISREPYCDCCIIIVILVY